MVTGEQWLAVQVVGFGLENTNNLGSNHDREHLPLYLAYIVIELDTTSYRRLNLMVEVWSL